MKTVEEYIAWYEERYDERPSGDLVEQFKRDRCREII